MDKFTEFTFKVVFVGTTVMVVGWAFLFMAMWLVPQINEQIALILDVGVAASAFSFIAAKAVERYTSK